MVAPHWDHLNVYHTVISTEIRGPAGAFRLENFKQQEVFIPDTMIELEYI